MIETLTFKWVNLTPPAALVNNASPTIAVVDTKGYSYLDIIVVEGATDIAYTVAKLQSSDANSGYADYVGSRYGTDASTTLPSATSDNGIFGWHVNLQGKMRWWKPVITIGNGSTGAYLSVIALLSRAGAQPNTATLRGLAQEIFI